MLQFYVKAPRTFPYVIDTGWSPPRKVSMASLDKRPVTPKSYRAILEMAPQSPGI